MLSPAMVRLLPTQLMLREPCTAIFVAISAAQAAMSRAGFCKRSSAAVAHLLAAEIRGALFGSGEKSVQVARRLNSLFDEASPERAAIKQGFYSQMIEPAPGVTTKWGPEQVADRIYDFINGRYRDVTREYFNPNEVARLRGYADRLRASVQPPTLRTDVVSRAIDRIKGLGGQGAEGPGTVPRSVKELALAPSGPLGFFCRHRSIPAALIDNVALSRTKRRLLTLEAPSWSIEGRMSRSRRRQRKWPGRSQVCRLMCLGRHSKAGGPR
jgi:hypothetical protein